MNLKIVKLKMSFQQLTDFHYDAGKQFLSKVSSTQGMSLQKNIDPFCQKDF